jgi:CHAT domain-containing protein/Tfp pilus assembly protein PilF
MTPRIAAAMGPLRIATALALAMALSATAAAGFPPSDGDARKALIDEDPAAFASALDSALAVADLSDDTLKQLLEAGAEEYLEATGDSLLLADVHFVLTASREAVADWYRSVLRDDQALALRNDGDYQGSADAFREAAEIYRRVGHLRREAVAWGSLGVSIWYTGDMEAVGEAYARALAARERLGDPVLIGRTLNGLGSVSLRLGNYREALGYYRRARAVRETLDNPVDLGATVTYIGHVEKELGNLEEARSNYRRALELFGDDAPARRLNEVRGGLANVYASLGEQDKALEVYRSVLASAEAEADSELIAQTRSNISGVLAELGDYTEALRELNVARAILESSDNAYYLANTLNAVGGVYLELGDIPKALQAYQESRRRGEESGNAQETAYALANLGSAYTRMGLYDRALETYEEAAAMNRDLENPAGLRAALFGKAVALDESGKTEEALALYQEVVALDREAGLPTNQAEDLVNIANTLSTLLRFDEARAHYREALALARDMGLKRVLWPCNLGIGDSYEREGVLDSARVYNDRAIGIMENLKGSALSEETRTAFLGQRAYVYEAQIHVLAKLHDGDPRGGYAEAAFRVAEEGKAQALQEMLAEGHMDLDAGVPADLAEERDRTDRRIKSVQNQLRRGDVEPDSLRALTRRLGELEKTLAQVLERIRLQNPRLATLDAGKPVSLDALRETLLKKGDACLLEYALGDSASYLWVVTRKNLSLFRLPPRDAVETVARTLRTALSNPDPSGDAILVEAASSLYGMILGPAEPLLGKMKNAFVVPDGALHFVPFDGLLTRASAPLDPGADATARGDYLSRLPYAFLDASLDYGPSATTLMTLTTLERGRDRASMEFLGVGDPVFHASDDADAKDLSPLPFTRDEVTGIAKRFKPETETLLLGEDAAESRLLEPGFLGRYRILHFATHGLIDERHPERSRLALSYPRDPSEDGYLQASEIYGRRLAADLVVLSACETGRGRLVRGEGVLGLPRAFFYSGASSVVVSLWSVSDRSTTRLMQGFYEQFVDKKRPTAEALRRAKDALRQDPEFAHPFYWAPFVLMGAS